MGEGVLIYGVGGGKRRYTRDLQSFSDRVLARGKSNGSLYIFGKTNKAYLSDLVRRGVKLKSDDAAITDRTILKYKNHPKSAKGASVSKHRFRMVESAVKHPKNVYIDTKRNRLVYVATVKYAPSKVIKVVIEPNQKIGRRYYNQVTSIGIVNAYNMREKQFLKIK
ncbi:MAG: hypothetical protein IJ640_09755 [Prevotella sp.]|nr:hypothetical protein [Prevotella sp.]